MNVEKPTLQRGRASRHIGWALRLLLSHSSASCNLAPSVSFRCLDLIQVLPTPSQMPVFLDNSGRDRDSRVESIRAPALPNLGSTPIVSDESKYDVIVAGVSLPQ